MNKATIFGLAIVLISALIRLAQTQYMPGMLERMREGNPDPLFVPLGIATFVSFLTLPLGIIITAIGLINNSVYMNARKRRELQERSLTPDDLRMPEP